MHTNSCEFKQLLAYIREHDFAHPGEAEAIDMVFKHLPQQSVSQILDVGCGLGGTANYVEQNNWGRVTGIDIDATTIDYATQHYSSINFYTTDVLDVAGILPTQKSQFDIIYLFNSFYAFPQQEKGLQELRKVIKNTGYLAIFDYAVGDRDANRGDKRAILSSGELVVPYPILLSNAKQLLQQANWQLTSINYLHNHYLRWYQELVRRITTKEHELKAKFGKETFALLYEVYTTILAEIEQNLLSGAIIYARAI